MAKIAASIQPMLSVRRGWEALRFYEAAFGAQVAYQIGDPGGEIVARLSIDGAEFWIHDESANNPSPEKLGNTTFRSILIVDDPDAMFARALSAGAKATGEMIEEHVWRTGRVVDPFGHHWEISKPVDEPS